MKVQERHQKQLGMAMLMFFSHRTHGQILLRLQAAFGGDAVSARTLSYWISNFKSLEKEGINIDAPFELHLLEEYGLPIEASSYISEMLYKLSWNPHLPMFPSNPAYEARNEEWKPTARQIIWWWRVHNMADDFSYEDIYLIASHYCVREILEEIGGIPANYADLNGFMTYKPWRSDERTIAYREAVDYGKFDAITAADYPTRGIFNEEGEWMVGESIPVLWKWAQMVDKKYLSPQKALIMTIILSERLPIASHHIPRVRNVLDATLEEMEGLRTIIGEFNVLGELGYHDYDDFEWSPTDIAWVKAIADKRGLKIPSDNVLGEAVELIQTTQDQVKLSMDNYEEILWPVFDKEEYEEIREHMNQNGEFE